MSIEHELEICPTCEGMDPVDCPTCEGEVMIRVYRKDCGCVCCVAFSVLQ